MSNVKNVMRLDTILHHKHQSVVSVKSMKRYILNAVLKNSVTNVVSSDRCAVHHELEHAAF